MSVEKSKVNGKGANAKRTASGVAKTQPLKDVEKYTERRSDAATLDADSYAMRECFRSTTHLRRG